MVEKRSNIGDEEINTIIGNNYYGALVSLAERKPRLSLIARLPHKRAGEVKPAGIDLLSPLKAKIYPLTSGEELAEHQSMAKNLEAKFSSPIRTLDGHGDSMKR